VAKAPVYYLIDDYLNNPNSKNREDTSLDVTSSPFWAICIFPLAYPSSIDRSKLSTNLQGNGISISDNASDGVKLRSDPLIITQDAVILETHETKGQYTKALSAVLQNSSINYMSAIFPGDHIIAWMWNNEEDANSVITRIKNLEPCNLFNDGFKFYGRVEDIDIEEDTNDRGLNSISYSLSAVGFGELGSSIFYDPYLAEAVPLMGTWLSRIGGSINDLLGNPNSDLRSQRTAALDINKLLPFFVNLLLGDGIDKRYTNPGGDPELRIGTGLSKGDSGEAPYAYILPGEVGAILGKRARSRGTVLSYADIMEMVYGIQNYSGGANNTENRTQWTNLVPDGIEPPPTSNSKFPDALQRKATPTPMLGEFLPIPPDFSNKPIWTILNQWLNPTINELYTTLRVNEVGQVVPTLIARQLPFTTEVGAQKMQKENVPVTRFRELPRWVGHPSLIRRRNLRRSNSLRFNFVHIYGQPPDAQRANRYTEQIVRNPPIRDDLDIQRSGPRSYMSTVACSIDESVFGAKRWMALAADWLLDQHMLLVGNVEMELVQAPICIGDNFEYAGIINHIEGISHRCEVTSDGRKQGTTRLSLSHGMRSESDELYDEDDHFSNFALVYNDDHLLYGALAVPEEQRPEVKEGVEPEPTTKLKNALNR